MKTFLTILHAAYFCNVFSQSAEDNKYYLPVGVFNSGIYRVNSYKRFTGEIKKVGNTCYKFGDKILKVALEDTMMSVVFQKGIFNPDIIFGKETMHIEQAEIDTLSQNQIVFYNLIRNDTLSVCCFEQLEKLNPNAHTKRFKFWVFRNGVLNPTEYYLELQNDNATQTSPLKEFLEGSMMTFYYKGTLII